MKIIMYQPVAKSGLALYSNLLGNSLSKNGVIIDMFTPVDYDYIESKNYNVMPILFSKELNLKNRYIKYFKLIMINYLNIAYFTFYLLLKSKNYKSYRVIHFQVVDHLLDIPFIFLLKYLTNKKLVYTVHDVIPHRYFLKKSLENKVIQLKYKLFDRLIVHSKENKRQLLDNFKINTKISIIPHGPFNIKKESPNKIIKAKIQLNIDEGKVVGLFFGKIRDNKGLDILLKSIEFLKNDIKQRFVLIIAGSGNLQKYNELLSSLNNNIKVINEYITNEDVVKLFNVTDFVILPYKSFGSQSGVLKLALGINKPVITTNVGSLPETVKKRCAGIILEPRDSKSLADALTKLISEPKCLEEYSNNIKLTNDLDWLEISNLTKINYNL